MAVLKKIKFGAQGTATPIAKTVVTAKSGGVMTVAAPDGFTNGVDENEDYQYELDVNVDGTTLVKSTSGEGQQAVTQLAVGTVPAAQVSVADSGNKFAATNVEAALAELKDDIDSTGGAAKTYKIVEVAEADAANTSLKEYKVQVKEGSGDFTDDTASAKIVVPKDQHLKSVVLVNEDDQHHTGQFLKYTYVLNTGAESDVYVDVSSFLTQSEFGDGLEVSNAGVVSVKLGQGLEFGGETGENQSIKVKVDSTSEKDTQSTPVDFLTVGTNGIKIQGIGAEIDRKIAALDFTTDAAEAGQYVAAIEENNGLVAVKTRANVSEAVLKNYAKGSSDAAVAATDTINQAISKLENQIDSAASDASTAITNAINDLDVTDTAVAGKVVTAVSETDGEVSSTKADLAGITLGGFTQDATATGAIAATDTLGAALNKLENGIDAAAQAAAAGHTVVEHASDNTHVTVSGAANANGGTTYTVTESDIASAQALTNEISRAQTAEGAIDTAVGLTKASGSETRSFTPTTNYGGTGASAATSVMDNMQKIDTALNTLSTTVGDISYSVSGTELTFYGIPAHS